MVRLSLRTPIERMIDKLLLIYLFGTHKIIDDTKAQKTVFFAENNMNEKRIKGFSYDFIRWNFGEFSRDLESDLKELKNKNFITDNLILTQDGEEILNQIGSVLQKNSEIIKRIDMFGSYTESKSLTEVKDVAYTKIIVNGKQVKDLPMGEPLLHKLDDSEARINFSIDTGWLGTFEVLFNPRIKDSLDVALTEEEYIPFEV
ncbi:MAG: hypothetical protein NT016_03950 [Candidatus Aenigmarchaeota archaeon]|nr:hypothetical protein [Candidatus Aenigmarchaeota archaeon]